MTPAEDPVGRRRRRRPRRSAGPARPAATIPEGAGNPDSDGSAGSTGKPRDRKSPDGASSADHRRSRQPAEPGRRAAKDSERGWRDLVGSGPSQVGVSGALRARDAARPGPDELAEAERTMQLVRRQWQPPSTG